MLPDDWRHPFDGFSTLGPLPDGPPAERIDRLDPDRSGRAREGDGLRGPTSVYSSSGGAANEGNPIVRPDAERPTRRRLVRVRWPSTIAAAIGSD
jgi:hypothetical protein